MGKVIENINLEKVFSLLTNHMANPEEAYTLADGIKLTPSQQKSVCRKAIQAFFLGSGKLQGGKVIQAFSGSSDLPVLTKDVFNVTTAMAQYDTAWQMAFFAISLLKGQLSWEIADVASGLQFALVKEGEKAKIFGVSGSKVTVGIEKYGAGIGITWEMIEGRKLYQFVEVMQKVKSALNALWADTHYGLLATAAAAHTTDYQLTTDETTLERDIATINKGYETIGNATKDKGYGDTANQTMLLYYSPALKARVLQALGATSADIVKSGKTKVGRVVFNVEPIATWNAAIPDNKLLMVLPGNKIQNSVYAHEIGFKNTDPLTLSEVQVYWSAFGAFVGDTTQCSELAFA